MVKIRAIDVASTGTRKAWKLRIPPRQCSISFCEKTTLAPLLQPGATIFLRIIGLNLMRRREFLAAAAAGGSAILLHADTLEAPPRRLEGIFPIMQTPFTDSGALDHATLQNEVRFLARVGAQGMVRPQLASEYVSLTEEERLSGADTIVRAVRALKATPVRPVVVIGVQAANAHAAARYARHADQLGADAVIAIPLDGGKDESKQMDYYAAIGAACSKPLIVQTIGNMSVDLVLRMAKEIPTLRYAKDEAGVTLARLTDYRQRGQILQGVFTGAHGPTFLDELARGAVGNMPSSGFADLYVGAWQAWKNRRQEEAMDIFSKALLLIMDARAYGIPGQKYILQLRGVFPNSKCRGEPANALFDDEAKAAIQRTVNYAKKWFTA
jgi:4-hydroxy-tetrahydrodipicolinate synthase